MRPRLLERVEITLVVILGLEVALIAGILLHTLLVVGGCAP